MRRIIIFFFISLFFLGSAFIKPVTPDISHKGNSQMWHKRNDHLIPDEIELEAILSLDQDGDGVSNGEDRDIDGDGLKNFPDKDIDGDGIKNKFDPSPYDWREQGYNPFAVLAFLSWRHDWNEFKYDKEELKKTVRILKEMGCSFVRMDFYWNDVEPRKGVFDFEKYDYIVDLLSENNIRILGLLNYSANWAAEEWNNPPYQDEDFVNYSQKVVSRYKNKVKYWEVWNEPDSKFYWKPQDGMKRYAQLLKKVYPAVKEIDPSCKVLLGGLTQAGYYALKDLYRQGAGDYFDIVNFHPFVDPLNRESMYRVKAYYRNIKKLIKKYDHKDKKIWLTEIGCPGVKESTRANTWWEGKGPVESQQAEFVNSLYSEIISLPDVGKVFWAFFRDNKEHFKSGVDYFGLIRWDFSKKPSFYCYQKASLNWRKNELKELYKLNKLSKD